MTMLAELDARDPTAVAALVVLWLIPSYLVARLAERKGRSPGLWFMFAVVFSWLPLLVAILVLPSTSSRGSE